MLNNRELIDHLIKRRVLVTRSIIDALSKMDRINFIRPEDLNRAYMDNPLSIGYGQTISQPYTVVFMLELLQPEKGNKVLDIGSGSGWTTALLAYIVQKEGSVLGMEKASDLVKFGKSNIEKYNFTNAKIVQSGEELGKPEEQFDRILVSAAAREIPHELVDQLKIGGRMVIPVQSSIYKVYKVSEDQVEKDENYGFSFVPLIY
jgi:protein-L-isoaspartate(D-aspartate) O-methyltransferase